MNPFPVAETELPKCRILIIDDNSPFVLPLVRSFSGYRQVQTDVLLIYDKKPGHYRHSRYIGRIRQVPALDDRNTVPVLRDAVEQFKSDLIVTTREWISALLHRRRKELESFVLLHPLPEDATLEITGDKWNLNRWLRKNGFPSARVSGPAQGWTDGFPVLLKPVKGIGGQGIRVLHSQSQLERVLSEEERYTEGYFLMEYIDGYDIDVSFFAIGGEIIYYTIQRGLISGHMVYSKGIEFVHNEALLAQVTEMVRKLDYTGIAHLDFRFDSGKKEYVLVDFNARYWSSVQGSRAMGINFPYLAVVWTLTQKSERIDYRTGHYYFSGTALRTLWRNLFSRRKYPVRLKDTQLHFLCRDPLPELTYLMKNLPGFLSRKKPDT